MHRSEILTYVTLVFIGLIATTFCLVALDAFRTGRESPPRLRTFVVKMALLTVMLSFMSLTAACLLALTIGSFYALGRYRARKRPTVGKNPDRDSPP